MGDYMTVSELREMLCVSRATAYRIAGVVPHIRVGRAIRISRKGLESYLRAYGWTIPTSSEERPPR